MFLKTLKIASFVCTKSKVELFIFAIFLHFLNAKMNRYSWARDGFIVMYWFTARDCWKTAISYWISGKFSPWSRSSWCLAFELFFSRLSDRKLALLARKAYSNSIFFQGHVILWDRKNFCGIFFAFHLFSLSSIHVVSRAASEGLLLKFYYTPVWFKTVLFV